jgi:putative inorganic carbon (HCO3(-)) transporter
MPKRIEPETIKKIALVNFGGIGDEILFSPVVEEIRQYLPQAHTTLFLEDRSRAVKDLLPGVDTIKELNVQDQPRWKTFFQLWGMLRSKYFDVVISSGSSPFIPVLLFLSGIPVRVGFGTGAASRRLLTVEAPLAPKHDRKGYAGQMYFALAQSFLQWLLPDQYLPMQPVLPHLKPPALEDLLWAKSILKPDQPEKKILVHPGVSTVSVQKNILKSWAPSQWAELIQQLTTLGHRVYLVGGPDDRQAVESIRQALPPELPNFVDLYGQTKNLRQLAALIQQSNLLLCVDSSPMHMAVGYGKPVVAMFGPTDEKKLVPPEDPRFQVVAVQALACRPCLWDVRNDCCDKPVCLDVPVSAMLDAVNNSLHAGTTAF